MLAFVVMFFALCTSAHEERKEPYQGLVYCGYQRWADNECFMHCRTPQDDLGHYQCPTLGKAYRDLEPPQPNRKVTQIGYGCYTSPSPSDFFPSYSITVEENGQRVWLGRQPCVPLGNSAPPVMPMVSIDDATVTEGPNGQAEFTVTLSETSESPVMVEYSTAGVTAMPDEDFAQQDGMLTIQPGDNTGKIRVMVYDDEEVEETETFMVLLSNAENAEIDDGDGIGTITDNDEAAPPALPTLSINDVPAAEGDDAEAVFTVTLSAFSADTVTVGYATASGTATEGDDYTGATGTVTIAPNQQTGTIRVAVLNDTEVESSETFTVTLSGATNATIRDREGVGTITDDDERPLPTLSINDVPAAEGDDAEAVFTVTLSAFSADTVTVGYATASGTATEGDDYTGATGTVTIAPNQQTGTIRVAVLNDTEVESSETFTVTLSGATNATIRDREGVGTITDDDERPLPTLSINDVPAAEGDDAEAVFTVTLSAFSADTVTVGYATANGTATEGDDYTGATGTVTIAPNQQTGTIRVAVLNDTEVESSETFTVTLSGATNATIRDREGVGTITDDDERPLPTLSINDVPAAEGDDAEAVFTVTLSAFSADTVTVGYATANGTATEGDDYTGATGTVTIAPNQQTGTIRVAVLNDTEVESSETFTVTLSGATNATIRDREGVGTITDDDERPLPTLSINDVPAAEGDDAEAVFTVTLSAFSADTVTVGYATANGTATEGDDYTGATGTVTIAPNQQTGTIRVAVLNDTEVESSETFTVTLSGATNATIRDREGVGTITDDDERPLPTLSINDVPAAEGDDAEAVFTVTLSAFSADTVTVGYATANGTATEGDDYTGATGTVTIAPNQQTGTIRVAVLNDTEVESSETFTVTLSGATNATIRDREGVGTITDDDERPLPTLSINDVPAAEGDDAEAVFTVTLSAFSADTVTVGYATANGTATEGDDYTGATGTVTIAPNQQTGTIRVAVLNDTEVESSETFTVTLSGATNATIRDREGVGTITDDDEPPLPTLSINDATVTEAADAEALFTVTLSATSADAVTVNYMTSDDTATAGNDYTTANGTLTIEAGERTGMITVAVLDDSSVEDAERFTVTLSTPANATIGHGVGTGTINDDDGTEPPPPLPTLSINNATVTEEVNAEALFTVTLNEVSTDAVTVGYATADGTAMSGDDYTTANGTLTIDAGKRFGMIGVTVLDDATVEQAETFTLTLSGAVNATIEGAEGTGTIIDDDEPAPPTLSINDATVTEGETAEALFTVTLSAPSTDAVTVGYATADGTAMSGDDYTTANGTLTIDAGKRFGMIGVTVLDDATVEQAETFTLTLSGAVNATIEGAEGTGTIIDDDEPAPPTLSINDATVTEGETAEALFTVTLSAPSTDAVTVGYATADGTAMSGDDYTTANGTLTIDAGKRFGMIGVTVLDDATVEQAETFTLTLSGAVNATIEGAEGTGTIIDDDEPAPPTLSINDATVTEGETAEALFTVTLSAPSTDAVTVGYATADGTAMSGDDYTTANGTLTIDAGKRFGMIGVTVLDDATVEQAETFTLTLSGAVNATIEGAEGTGTIIDDDEPAPPTLSINDATVTEGETAEALFTVTLSAPSTDAVTVGYATADGTAMSGDDYTTANGTLTIDAGKRFGMIGVTVLDDATVEQAETFTLTLSGATNATILDGEGVGTITDDDEPPLPTLSINDAPVTEGDDAEAVFTVTLSAFSADTVTVGYATANGTATEGDDYTGATGTVTIAPNQQTGTIRVAVLNDTEVESSETFTVTLSGATNATILDGEGVGTITDDDEPPLPTLSINDAPAAEGDDAEAVFTVTLSAFSADTVTVGYATANGTATEGDDYTGATGTVTIAPNQQTGTIRVAVLNDTEVESSETFTVTLSGATNATILDGEGVGTITDDDEPPLPTLSINDAPVTEGDDAEAVFTVTLSAFSADTVTVGYATANGTATEGDDYTGATGTVTIAPNQQTGTIRVAVLNDTEVESSETFTVTLSGATNATILDGEGVGTITDDDEPPLPTLSINDAPVTEGDDAEAVFTVTLSAFSADTVTVGYATANGTATEGDDYTGATGTVTIAPNQQTGTIRVAVLNDTEVESSETFTVTLSGATNATILDGEGVGTITDDDEPPLPTLSINDAPVTEGDDAGAVFTVTLSAFSADTVTVDYATANGTATEGDDYTGATGTVTIAPNQQTGTIRVAVLNDTEVESSETFTVTLSGATNATIRDREGVGTITDDDVPPPSLSINDATVTEAADAEALFTVTLSATSADAVTVNYTTSDGTATAGIDYTSTTGTLSIPAGDRSGTIRVPILDDDASEETEKFTVTLSDATNATIEDSKGIATITDDVDVGKPPALSIDDVTVAEVADAKATFTVTLSAATSQPVTVDYATSDGSAVAGVDYTRTSGVLTIAAGDRRATVEVPILDDDALEDPETFTVTLSAPTNATIEDSRGVGTITDANDADKPPSLSIGDVTVAELPDAVATFTVTLSGTMAESVMVDYATSDGTAKAGTDYTRTGGTLTIPAGDRTSNVPVPVLDDDKAEQAETFSATLSNPVNATIADPQGTATITDDDPTRGLVGLAKELVRIETIDPGRYRTVFRLHAVNVGDGDASGVQIAEDLSLAFPGPASFTVVSVAGGDGLTLNAGFDGMDDTNLLTGEDTMAAADSATLDVSIEVSLNEAAGPFENQAVAVSTNESGATTRDLSDDGSNPDANGNGDPSDPGEDDPTPVEFPASLVGTIFADHDVDGTADNDEPRLSGWRVEAVSDDGGIIASAVTGEAGDYAMAGLEPGAVTVRFRHGESNVAWREVPVVSAANTVSRMNYGAVPGGRVYNSISRELITGVAVSLVGEDDAALPSQCLLDGQQGQRTASDGAYRFVIVHGSHTDCPRATADYRVRIVEAPNVYAVRPSLIVPPESDTLTVATCQVDPDPSAPCVVTPYALPASAMSPPSYYYGWAVADGDGTVVHNHIPLDDVSPGTLDGLASVSKSASVATAVQGDLVGYKVRIANGAGVALRSVELSDQAPAGFSHVATAATLTTAGMDGQLDTVDDLVTEMGTTLAETALFGPFDVPANSTVAVRYLMRVSTSATPGRYVNAAKPVIAGERIGNVATASVDVVADPLFAQTTLIGKVFDDRNGNGRQDHDEPGIPGVRIASVQGLIVETDAYGRYHLAGLDTVDADRGTNFIVKLDPRTLPRDAELVSENPRVVRLTSALMSKANFAVRLPAPVVSQRFVREVMRHSFGRVESVRFESGKSRIPDSYLQRWRDLLELYRHERGMRVRFAGHTDSQALSPRTREVYGDNQGLSEARAREVAEFVAAELGLDENSIETVGNADRIPIASNGTPEGRALNRRVDVAFLFDKVDADEQPVAGDETVGDRKEARYAEETVRIEPVRFTSTDAKLTADQAARLDDALASYAEVEVLGATVVGHADANSDGPGEVKADSGSVTLDEVSGSRARNVAAHLVDTLGIDPARVRAEGRGAGEPLADGASEFGQILNRRADIQITYKRAVETVTERRVVIEPAQLGPVRGILGGGRVWLTEDVTTHRPQLDVLALNDVAVDAAGKMTTPVTFATHGNYGDWVSSYRLAIHAEADTDLARPLAVMSVSELQPHKAFEFLDKTVVLKPGTRLAYVLTAQDENGRQDVTHVRLVEVVEAGETGPDRDPASMYGQSNLATQAILIHGSRVRVHGDGFRSGETIRVDGQDFSVGPGGRFVTEMHAAPGVREIQVSGVSDGFEWTETLTAEIDENYTFVVGLANLAAGGGAVSGSFEELSPDDDFDDSIQVEGRLALYLKAKIRGRYLVTAQLDTTQDELDNLGDNLKRRDPRRLFRQLDPNRYYPVYGDDSTTTSDVDTVGAYYLRVDWDRNQVLLGNFNTGLTDTETMQYNRSLHGARVTHKSPASTRYGDTRRSLTAFASEAQTAAAHVSFHGTGGSLYYLKHTDIVEGSDKVSVEVRQRDTHQVVERREFVRGRDYEIDALQGRIILRRPLSPVVGDRVPAIIRSRPLDGDDVFLLVDYEYIVDALTGDRVTYGARGRAWLGDHVAIGATKVTDERDGGDFGLVGMDVTVKAGRGTYLTVETAGTEAMRNASVFESRDGGITFQAPSPTEPSAEADGDAVAVEGRVNLAEFSEKLTGNIRAWWKNLDAGFSALRFSSASDTTESGFDATVEAGEDVDFRASYAQRDQGRLGSSQVARVQTDVRVSKVTLGGELRHEDRVYSAGGDGREVGGEALTAGVRLGYDIDERRTVYGSVQSDLSQDGGIADNDLVAVGLNARLNKHTAVSVEASDGDRGSALLGGFEYSPAKHLSFSLGTGIGSGARTQFSGNYQLADGHELYGSYTVDTDRTFGERNLLTLGQRRDMGNRLGIFTESHFGESDRHAGTSHTFGLDYETDHGWVLSGLVTRSSNETATAPFERDAISLGAAVKGDDYRFSSKLEHRSDAGPGVESDQVVASSNYTHIVSPNRRWLAGLKIALTDDRVSGGDDARFVELDIGHAYRPVADDRWNSLFKVGYFHDLVSAGQDTERPGQRVGILAFEALRSLGSDWEFGTKVAIKEGRLQASRESGTWHDYGVALGIVRLQRHVIRKWEAVGEYRYLRDRHADTNRHGALIGAYRQLGDHAKIGVGFNFTEFSDDIRDAQYNHRGWFIDLVGKL